MTRPCRSRCRACNGPALLAAVLLAAACRPVESRPSHTQRVVSLLPSATEIVVALGAADRLIARTEYDTDPALAHLPSIGRGMTPDAERLLVLDPDLILSWPAELNPAAIGALRRLDLPVREVRAESIEDVFRAVHALGRWLRLEDRADSLARSIRAELDRVSRAVAGRERPHVLYLVWDDPPRTVGPGSYIDELITIAGGRNAFGDAPSRWPQVDPELILARDPDVLIVPVGGHPAIDPRRLVAAPVWRDLAAVRERRMFTVEADLFHHPGPHLGTAARRLAEILHRTAIASPAREPVNPR